MASNIITRADDSDLTIVGGFVPDALLPVATPVVTETVETDGEGIVQCRGDANGFNLAYVFIALWVIFWHFVAIRIAQALPHVLLAAFLAIYFGVAALFLFRATNRALRHVSFYIFCLCNYTCSSHAIYLIVRLTHLNTRQPEEVRRPHLQAHQLLFNPSVPYVARHMPSIFQDYRRHETGRCSEGNGFSARHSRALASLQKKVKIICETPQI